ncbi:hypothetical protein EIP91_005476 [Steccherinum ochraceum]|uniref:Uncharacterized protein n=1 Tax=Steccherinum ochraceum TaxID=92696 RepID=A0A4R0RS09_9APHY|nr:hypothetical protein EIP91_005476 [Steccherinum ochraceum]
MQNRLVFLVVLAIFARSLVALPTEKRDSNHLERAEEATDGDYVYTGHQLKRGEDFDDVKNTYIYTGGGSSKRAEGTADNTYIYSSPQRREEDSLNGVDDVFIYSSPEKRAEDIIDDTYIYNPGK